MNNILLVNSIRKMLDIWEKVLTIEGVQLLLATTLDETLSYLTNDEIKLIICSDTVLDTDTGEYVDCPDSLFENENSGKIPMIIVNTNSSSKPYQYSPSVLHVYDNQFIPSDMRALISEELNI
mgnify:CR=1 FL=1